MNTSDENFDLPSMFSNRFFMLNLINKHFDTDKAIRVKGNLRNIKKIKKIMIGRIKI